MGADDETGFLCSTFQGDGKRRAALPAERRACARSPRSPCRRGFRQVRGRGWEGGGA